MPAPQATVVITTRNRKEDLLAAIDSALAQTAACEVMVMDDASTDGTRELIAARFPSVVYQRSDSSVGYIVQRNGAARLASAPILVSMDDDAVFSSPRTVEQTLEEFTADRIGAVTIPLIDVNRGMIVHQRAHRPGKIDVAYTFIGTAHALRRDLFLKLGGYREALVHQTEEIDFSARMLAAGFVVRMGTADPIQHFESPRRDFRRIDYYSRRNDVLYAWHNVPMPYFPVHLAGTTMNGIRLAWRSRRFGAMLRGLAAGYAGIFSRWSDRRPLPRGIYRLTRELQRNIWLPLEDVQGRLKAEDTSCLYGGGG